jgi:hypothetical protein
MQVSDKYVKVTDVEATIEEAKVFSHEIVHWLMTNTSFFPRRLSGSWGRTSVIHLDRM